MHAERLMPDLTTAPTMFHTNMKGSRQCDVMQALSRLQRLSARGSGAPGRLAGLLQRCGGAASRRRSRRISAPSSGTRS